MQNLLRLQGGNRGDKGSQFIHDISIVFQLFIQWGRLEWRVFGIYFQLRSVTQTDNDGALLRVRNVDVIYIYILYKYVGRTHRYTWFWFDVEVFEMHKADMKDWMEKLIARKIQHIFFPTANGALSSPFRCLPTYSKAVLQHLPIQVGVLGTFAMDPA